ncbi:hypothetical protein EUTSA_v10019670mg [Eutrema salsugineum]|uniref:non-specific serine/threonine protein kinase n=1 Tax=Eutrema salsugineum TaxID=72664 RepID=V4JSF7_EUTSA|nr:hypothetical protein EUTSA_v10019670mg [Eutrema salsugineum]
MSLLLVMLVLFLFFFPMDAVSQGSDLTGGQFSFNGYLYTDGVADLNRTTVMGLISLTNSTMFLTLGQVFYNFQLRFKDSVNGNVYSFSTTFIFAIVYGTSYGDGLSFALSPTKGLSNVYSMRDPNNHIVAVDLATFQSSQFDDIDIHVGVDINNLQCSLVPHRFAYKDLHITTKGFSNTELLGRGGFGKVYKGTLPVSNIEIAVKRVSHDSRQGMREFIAEIATIGRLRHLNLVRLQGYCRHKGELYLVYDCMPKGSLDKFLYHQKNENLDWSQRFKIIKDVASGLCYLHQQWVQVIIHRDIKPANILLDETMNAKLGDFGLAKLCDHGIDPQTSHVSGTLGYISPELSRTGKASTRSDVFALGVVMLEITCGRKPILSRASQSEMVLTDWVLECWENGNLMQVLDNKIRHEYIEEQVELVLKLGLLCSHPVAAMRPSMSSVIQFMDNVSQLPHNLLEIMKAREISGSTDASGEAADSPESSSIAPLTFTESFVSHGR